MERNIEIENKIKQIFKNYKLIQKPTLKIIFKNYPIIENYCNDLLLAIPEYENIINIIKSITNNIKLKNCKSCNKLLKFSQKIYCCRQCSKIDPDIINKRKQTYKNTCLQKYGVTNTMQVSFVKEKSKKTCKEKYGRKCTNLFIEYKTKI